MDVLAQPLIPGSVSLRQVMPVAVGALFLLWLLGAGRFTPKKSAGRGE